MFKTDLAKVAVKDSESAIHSGLQSDQFAVPRTSSPGPNQAIAKRGKLAQVSKSVRRKPIVRNAQLNVLVVDDVPDVTEMIALLLKHAGYNVTTAGSAAAALQLAGEGAFDVIISDIGMPEMNGYELATSLRALTDYQGIPIIAVTGYSEYDDRSRALQAGFDAHLTKPIDPTQLLDLMNELSS